MLVNRLSIIATWDSLGGDENLERRTAAGTSFSQSRRDRNEDATLLHLEIL